MSRAPITIADLKIGNNVWKLAARVVDLWIVKDRNGQQHFEGVLQDSKCDKIHVVTRNRDFNLWKQRLREHQTVMVYNGDPLNNDLALKVCDNPLKLVFNGGTTVTVVDMPEIPAYQFCFKPIVDFLHGDFRVNRLYDVIGVLHEVGKTQVVGGGKKACLNLIISDEIGSEIDLTLWEAYAT
ncbi:unnamed protein product [Lathyrus sativus]|nr:unnamed protein product [Lathyrus sativus]